MRARGQLWELEMNDSLETNNKGVALAFMKRASRDTFRLCARSADQMAEQIEAGTLPMDATTALKLLALYIFMALVILPSRGYVVT